MIVRRSQAEIAKLRRANQLVGAVLGRLRAMVAPGVTTQDIDAAAEAMVLEARATPAFKGYHGYPATICISVNEQVVHGIPSKRPLLAGDIVSLDMGAVLDGYYGDSAVTVPVGEVSAQAKVNNLADRQYETAMGYNQPGQAFYVTLRWQPK